MAFTIPEFPLSCDIYTGPWLTKVFRLNVMGNLGVGKRVLQIAAGDYPPNDKAQVISQLLLPAGTDVRDWAGTGPADIVEVPSGSGRWYFVAAVDDAGKGFPNEHRFAWILKASSKIPGSFYGTMVWPTPIP